MYIHYAMVLNLEMCINCNSIDWVNLQLRIQPCVFIHGLSSFIHYIVSFYYTLLHREGNTALKGHIVRCYKLLHKTTSDIRRDVEAHLRTLNAGEIPWSPRLQVYCDTIEYWLHVVKLRKNVNTSRKAFKRLARRLHLYKGYHVDLEYAGLKLQEAYQTYYEARKNAPAWRDEHNQSLVDAL